MSLSLLTDLDSKTSTSSLSPPSSKQDQINVDDAFRDRRVISVSIDSCNHNVTRTNFNDKKGTARDAMMMHGGADGDSNTQFKGPLSSNCDDKVHGTKATGFFNLSCRSSNCDDGEMQDMHSDISIEDDVIDLNNKVRHSSFFFGLFDV